MKNFDDRWQRAARAAHAAEPAREEAAPFGFATRVAAAWFAAPEPGAGWLWQAIALRALGSAAALLLAALAFSLLAAGDGSPLEPTVEGTVEELFWLL